MSATAGPARRSGAYRDLDGFKRLEQVVYG
jgi:hypothetical protein